MNELLLFRILFAISFFSVLIVTASYRYKAQKGQQFSLEEEGKSVWIPLRLLGLIIWFYPLFVIFAPNLVGWSLIDLPAPLRWLGFITAVLMIPFVIWSQNSLGNNVTTTVITREEHQLVTHGPYKWIRNPLYTAGIIAFSSWTLLSGSWFMGIVAIVGLVFILIRLPNEEAHLEQRFGEDYRAYKARTGRFLPKLL